MVDPRSLSDCPDQTQAPGYSLDQTLKETEQEKMMREARENGETLIKAS